MTDKTNPTLLSKLRAPVADERAGAVNSEPLPVVARLYYGGSPQRRYRRASTQAGPGEPLCFVSVAEAWLRRKDARIAALEKELAAALASAPVAGEAVARVDANDDGLFVDFIYGPDGSPLKYGDLLYAAPQASEAVRDAALNDAISILLNLSARYRHNYDKEGCNSYHEGGADALDEAEQAIRALSAQSGAQRTGGSDAE